MPDQSSIGQSPDRRALLRLMDVACRRGERLVWQGISLTVHAGAALHISGPNGAGKSSLLRIAAGLLPPAAGTVECHARAGLIDDNVALDRDRPLAQALRFWTRVDGQMDGRDRIARALDSVGMAALAGVPLRLFSTGQRKRASLARLIVADTPLWLLDEPANGLDADGVAMLTRLIAAHRAAGGAVLLASHLPLAMADPNILTLGGSAC